jgi:hypothetical protein
MGFRERLFGVVTFKGLPNRGPKRRKWTEIGGKRIELDGNLGQDRQPAKLERVWLYNDMEPIRINYLPPFLTLRWLKRS